MGEPALRQLIHPESKGCIVVRKLNYRSGLQRIYTVGSVVWIVLAFTVAVRDRPGRPDWFARNGTKTASQTEVDAIIEKYGGKPATTPPVDPHDWITVTEGIGKFVPPPLSNGQGPALRSSDTGSKGDYTISDSPTPPAPDPWKVVKVEPPPGESQFRYWGYRSAIALIVPGLGYLFMFWILPWIGRGFTHA